MAKSGRPGPTDWTTFKGKFFHEVDKQNVVQRQGRILGLVGDDMAIIQYFEFLTGSPSSIVAVYVARIVEQGWKLYSTAEIMREAYEYNLGVRHADPP